MDVAILMCVDNSPFFIFQRKTVKKGLIFTHYFKSTVHNGGKVVSLFWSLWLFLKTFVKIRLSTAHLITTGLVHAVQKKKVGTH